MDAGGGDDGVSHARAVTLLKSLASKWWMREAVSLHQTCVLRKVRGDTASTSDFYVTITLLPAGSFASVKWFSPATPAVTSPLPRGVHGSLCLGGYQRPRAVDGISTLRCVRSITLSADCSADILRRLYAELKVEERDWLVPAPDRSRVAQVGSVPHAP